MSDRAPRSPIRDRIAHARRFVREGIWDLEPSGMGAVRSWLLYNVRMGVLVAEGALRDHLLLRAAALTYKTVFSIVPLIAVMLCFFKAFGGTERVGDRLRAGAFNNLTPGLREVMEHLNTSVANIHAGAVGGIGVLILLYTAISLLTTVEKSFNHIWGVKQGRSFFWRCIIYWGALTLGPVVVMTSLAATTFVQRSDLLGWVRENLGWANDVILYLTPFLFAWFGFATVYYFMPNTRVRWRSAFVGGIVGGTLWEVAKHGYIFYMEHVVTTFRIYGSLGAVPMFLLWIYISWIVVLFGAECAFAHEHVRTYRREIDRGPVSVATRVELALRAMLLIGAEFRAGRSPVTVGGIGEAFNVPVRLVREVLHPLGTAGLVREVAASEPAYVPGRDPETITVKAVLDAIHRSGAAPAIGRAGQDGVVPGILARAESALERELGGVSLAELARKSQSSSSRP